MGGKEEVCGAVTAAILVIGAKYGRGENDDRRATESTYAKTREFMDAFSEQHGTYVCRQLLNGCDVLTPEGMTYFKENDLLNKTCKPCVQTAAEILEGILETA